MNPTDPMSQFKERYQQYVETKAPTSPPVMNSSGGKSFFNKFYVQGLIVGVVIVISGVLVYLNFKPSDQNNNTAVKPTPQPLTQIPTQTPRKIEISESLIDAEMQERWGSDYEKNKNDPTLREVAKQNLLRKKLLEDGLVANNVSFSSVASIEDPGIQEYKSQEALKKQVVTSRTIDEVAAYVDPQSKNYETNRKKALASLGRIREDLAQGISIDDAYEKEKKSSEFYPDLRVLKDEWISKKSGMLKPFLDTLFTLKTGDVSEVLDSGGSIRLMKVTNAVDSKYDSIDDWFAAQQ